MVEATGGLFGESKERKLVASEPFFMKGSRMPSIISFSTVLCFYGGKNEMRLLLNCVSKGGRRFFERHVKRGHFFKTTVVQSNCLLLNAGTVKIYKDARARVLASTPEVPSAPLGAQHSAG